MDRESSDECTHRGRLLNKIRGQVRGCRILDAFPRSMYISIAVRNARVRPRSSIIKYRSVTGTAL